MMSPTVALLVTFFARTITLDEAERTAEANQPLVRVARANTAAGDARTEQARAPVLPQVKGEGLYERTTGNRAQKPGRANAAGNAIASAGGDPVNTFDFYNWWDFQVSANLVLWDFGQTLNRWRAAEVRAQALGDTERATRLQAIVAVRATFFKARAQKALVQVGRETLANYERHYAQTDGFVKAGTRPEIDLAQATADRANARVRLIAAENAYAMARADLNQAMGVTGGTDYDVADQMLGPVEGEDAPVGQLITAAEQARPDIRALDQQIRGQELTLRATKGAYGPTLSLVGGAETAGSTLDRSTILYKGSPTAIGGFAWNFFGGLQLNWPIFQGFLTRGQVREADAVLDGLRAQRDGLIQQVWVAVQQSALAVRAAREALGAADEALTAANVRLRLAEGRYKAGVGNAIELGDAQLAATAAAAQRVGAEYDLAAARAELLVALGRR
jgi:outer membrane protein